jgi:hypothetical protein
MTQRLNYQPCLEGLGGCIHICGNFTTAGAAAPTVFSNGPFAVTKVGTGLYRVTFKEQFTEFLSGDTQMLDATASAKTCYIRNDTTHAPNVGTANTNAYIEIETQSTAGTAADLTGPIVSFDLNWRKGTLKK